MILQKLSFYRGIFDLFGRASKPIPLQFLLMGFSIMILLLRHSFRGHTFNSLFHYTYACVAIIGSGHKRSSGWKMVARTCVRTLLKSLRAHSWIIQLRELKLMRASGFYNLFIFEIKYSFTHDNRGLLIGSLRNVQMRTLRKSRRRHDSLRSQP